MTFCQNSFIIEEMLYEAVKKTDLSSNSVYVPYFVERNLETDYKQIGSKKEG